MELKTQKNEASVDDFIAKIDDPVIREDCRILIRMMEKSTGSKPGMWGDSIVGFGTYLYKYADGREGEWFQTGFSPRKQNLTIYLMYGFDRLGDLLGRLGKHKTGKTCLYVKNLSSVNPEVLQEIIDQTVQKIGDQE